MNLNPNQSDETIDDALLDEALSEATPEELEAKILALTDPQMLSLLDEAMAPEASDQLSDRILAATSDHFTNDSSPRLAGSAARRADTETTTGVLARIGPSTFRYAAAAAIALAAGLGFYFINPGPDNTDSIAVDNTNPTNAVEDDATAADPEWLTNEQYVSNDDDYFGGTTSPIETVLEEAADSLEDVTITRDTLWAELDAYEQFLDDIES